MVTPLCKRGAGGIEYQNFIRLGDDQNQALGSLQSGFTLFEILVTVLVIAVGLLGNAGIQALSLNNTVMARNRSLAAMEASGLASMMHANTAYWQLGSPTSSCSVSCSTSGTSSTSCTTGGISGHITLGDAILSSQNTDCTTTSCSGLQMASYDLQNWGASVASALPNGTGLVTCNTAAPLSCTINICWTQQNLTLNPTATPTTTSTTRCGSTVTTQSSNTMQAGQSVVQIYTMVVQP